MFVRWGGIIKLTHKSNFHQMDFLFFLHLAKFPGQTHDICENTTFEKNPTPSLKSVISFKYISVKVYPFPFLQELLQIINEAILSGSRKQ